LEFSTVYLDDVNGISDIYSSTFGVIGVAVAALPRWQSFWRWSDRSNFRSTRTDF